jgi:hypothetical protein
MEENDATSSGSPHTPSMTTTTRGVSPPKSPSQVRATMISTASTSGSGSIPSMVAITTPFTQSATSPSFSYRMPNFDMNSVLSYSTLQTLGLGVGILNVALQGSMGGTSAPYNYFPYDGGHISPSSPSLDDTPQQPVWSTMNYNLSRAGSQGPSSSTTPMGSLSFSLFGAFGNNTFSSAIHLGRGKPWFWITKSCAGYYSYTGGTHFSMTLESVAGISSLVRDVDRGKPLSWSMEPQARLKTYAHQISMGQPFLEPLEHYVRRNPFSSLNVLLWESSDDISTSATFECRLRPWFLPEPRLAA